MSRLSTTSAYVILRSSCFSDLFAVVEGLTVGQILVDGPSKTEGKAVPRHSAPLSHISLTPIVLKALPRAAGNGPLKAAWEKQEIEKKWANSAFAKSRVNRDKRRQLTDFERYKVLRLKKQVSKKSWFWKGFWNFWIWNRKSGR